MNSSPKKKIIEALKDQKEIFGDDLFEDKTVMKYWNHTYVEIT